jgi:hypothetical protein
MVFLKKRMPWSRTRPGREEIPSWWNSAVLFSPLSFEKEGPQGPFMASSPAKPFPQGKKSKLTDNMNIAELLICLSVLKKKP